MPVPANQDHHYTCASAAPSRAGTSFSGSRRFPHELRLRHISGSRRGSRWHTSRSRRRKNILPPLTTSAETRTDSQRNFVSRRVTTRLNTAALARCSCRSLTKMANRSNSMRKSLAPKESNVERRSAVSWSSGKGCGSSTESLSVTSLTVRRTVCCLP